MELDLGLNLATFCYFDGFGFYSFYLTRFGLDLITLFSTFAQFWIGFETSESDYCIE